MRTVAQWREALEDGEEAIDIESGSMSALCVALRILADMEALEVQNGDLFASVEFLQEQVFGLTKDLQVARETATQVIASSSILRDKITSLKCILESV